MLLRPHREDALLIGFYLSRIIAVLGVAGLVPLVWAVLEQEWAPAASFLLMVGVAALLGAAGRFLRPAREHLDWSHGMVVVALTWLVVPAVGTIPLAMSGHYSRLLDAYFDAMSGITTTGLALIQDLDHLAASVNAWRHTLHFLGGQGIVLAALTFFAAGGILALYHGEARDEKIFPSVTSTARFIWLVSLFHAAVGMTSLFLVGYVRLRFDPGRAFLHAYSVFMAAFDTGGFAPQSTSLGYYHSPLFEFVTAMLMVAGALSFGAHYALWRGPRNILRNLETKTILLTFTVTLGATIVGLAVLGLFSDAYSLTRQGTFQVLSAHTGTGFSTLSGADLARWSGLAFAGLATAMALGGMGSSTAGGVKALRIGLTLKALANTIREALLPEHSVITATYRQNGLKHLSPQLAQSVMAVSLLYVGLYLLGTAVGAAYGVPLQDALFESVSAAANVGLSVGVTAPGMPVLLEVVYILQMWAGRLEFIAVFALVGMMVAWAVGE